MSAPRILYLVTEDWYFWSHRLPAARAARDAGFEVIVAAAVGSHGDRIESEGFELVPISMKRSGAGIFREAASVWELAGLYKSLRPRLAHHVALKPVVFGAMAAALGGRPMTVNTLAGLGRLAAPRGLKDRAARTLLKMALRFALGGRRSFTVVQNRRDLGLLLDSGIVDKDRVFLIRGSGVDPDVFTPPAKEPVGTPVVLFSGRMLRSKGVEDFVKAARILKERGVAARMALVGAPDPHNADSLDEAALRRWADEGVVEYWGHRDDMPDVLRRATIVALPSFYGEGVPKSLIEGASCGRPLVAYDVPGCDEIIQRGENGFLAPARDVEGFADVTEKLLSDSGLRARMGAKGREMVIAEFSDRLVGEQTLKVYNHALEAACG
ncbi:MAG: glycosyltransferase family 4 protein [Candidatus Nitrospinota bacterium M3_3B_026]